MPDLSLDPSALTVVAPPPPTPLGVRTNGLLTQSAQKAAKPASTAPRVDLEPLYTNLKAAISEFWTEYKEAMGLFVIGTISISSSLPLSPSRRNLHTAFWYPELMSNAVLGQLNQEEFSLRTDHFLASDPAIEHLHNQLIVGIFTNVGRDPPEPGVAPFVSANDKPVVLPKPLSGDAAEQRLKTEVMQLPARDRRRLKDVAEVCYTNRERPMGSYFGVACANTSPSPKLPTPYPQHFLNTKPRSHSGLPAMRLAVQAAKPVSSTNPPLSYRGRH